MVRVRLGRPDATDVPERVFEDPRDVLESAIPGRFDERVAPAPDVVRRRARVQQNADGFEVPVAHGKRKRLRNVVPASDNAGIAVEQTAQRRRVAAGGGGDGRADVALAVGKVWLGHARAHCIELASATACSSLILAADTR